MKNGKLRSRENKFRLSDYIKEAEAVLGNQQKYHSEITEDFIKEYMNVLMSGRMYYDCSDSAKSPLPYVCVYDENGQVKEVMIDKMSGKCPFFFEERELLKCPNLLILLLFKYIRFYTDA